MNLDPEKLRLFKEKFPIPSLALIMNKFRVSYKGAESIMKTHFPDIKLVNKVIFSK